MQATQNFWRDGYAIIRNVFSPTEIEGFRNAALSIPSYRGDLLAHPTLHKIVYDKRILDLARSILGDDLVYFGDLGIRIGGANSGFHKDNPDKFDKNAPDWKGRYTLVRFGIYTQDHKGKPDGVDLRERSHEHCSTTIGKHVYADTSPGDVVCWNLRTSHSGGGMTVMGRPIDPESIIGKVLRRVPMLRDPIKVQRVALFWSYGNQSSHLERFITYLKTRKFAVDSWMAQNYSQAVIDEANAAGLRVRYVRPELEANPPKQVTVRHIDPPY